MFSGTDLDGGGGGSNNSSSTSGEGAGGGSIGEFSFGAATSSSPATPPQRFAATVRSPLAIFLSYPLRAMTLSVSQ